MLRIIDVRFYFQAYAQIAHFCDTVVAFWVVTRQHYCSDTAATHGYRGSIYIRNVILILLMAAHKHARLYCYTHVVAFYQDFGRLPGRRRLREGPIFLA